MNILGLKFSCKNRHFSAHKIIVTVNSKWFINAKSYKYIWIDKLEGYLMICRNAYICCIYICNLLPRVIKNLLSPLYLRQIVISIHKLSHKIELNLKRLGRGLQRFLLAFSPFCDELKYTPNRDFFPFF